MKKLAARLSLALASSLVFFVLAEVAYRALAEEEVTERNLHDRYSQYFRDAERAVVDAGVAARRGITTPVPDEELIEVGTVLESRDVRFRRHQGADGGPVLEIEAPAEAWQRPLFAGERIGVRGSATNDGFRTVLAFDGGVARVTGPLRSEDPGAAVVIGARRTRSTWGPDQHFYLCYRGLADFPARARYFDGDGCVECRSNSAGIRDREEVVALPKPAGQRRIVCIGDSFTFGWGVAVDDAWPRRVERVLRERDDGIRTVNCGAAGAIYVDEYASALEHRFGHFDPDAVVVSLCLNDLIPSSNALAHAEPPPWLLRNSRLLRDLLQGYALAASLRIDPDRDLVGELLALPDERYPPWATALPPNSVGRAALWAGGGAQRGLIAMRDWCAARDLPFGVVIWPYFQGLGANEHYPFARIHRLVGDFCGEQGIPFFDLLPTFERQVAQSSDLWVCVADYLGNERAQAMATPPLADFLGGLIDG